MSLIDAFMKDCVFMDYKRIKDGAGGYRETWEDGAELSAAIVKDTSMEARRAEKDGVSSVYTITVKRDVPIKYNDVVKRLTDGKYFRVTSDPDKETPTVSTLDIKQVTAEKYELPKGGAV